MKQVIYIHTVLLMLLALGACNKQLDQLPRDVPVYDNFWKTEKDANAGLAGAYAQLRAALITDYGGVGFMAFGDCDARLWDAAPRGDGFLIAGWFQFQSGFTTWNHYYRTINMANLVIEKIPEIPVEKFSGTNSEAAEKRARLLGEAYFIRAYTYFFMTRVWGEVPLVLQSVKSADEALEEAVQAKEDTLLAQCLKDAAMASSLLKWAGSYSATDWGVRASKGSALALEAHIYMWRTRQNRKQIDPQDFTRAEVRCDSVIRFGGYQLLDSTQYRSIFLGKSKEGIFELNFSIEGNEAYSNGARFADYFLAYPVLPRDVMEFPINNFNPMFLNLFTSSDKRTTSVFKGWPDRNTCIGTKYADIVFKDQFAYRGENNIVLMRMADIMLLRAEALTRLGRFGEAETLLNGVRKRSGLGDYVYAPEATDKTTTYIRNILEERLRELFMEGHALYDLVRTGFYSKSITIGNYDEARYLEEGHFHPVNPELIKLNRKLHQTPYWASRLQP